MKEEQSSLVEDPDKSVQKLTNPKLFILKILIKNLPQSVVKGKLRNMEEEFFDEYFSLLSSLIKISKDSFNVEDATSDNFFDSSSNTFFTESIMEFCIEIITTSYFILSGKKQLSDSKQSSTERLLCGYMQLCQSILEVIPQMKSKANLIITITDFIFTPKKDQKK